jgi:hypothetical protein
MVSIPWLFPSLVIPVLIDTYSCLDSNLHRSLHTPTPIEFVSLCYAIRRLGRTYRSLASPENSTQSITAVLELITAVFIIEGHPKNRTYTQNLKSAKGETQLGACLLSAGLPL